MGINPNTHKPMNAAVNGCQSKDSANLSHMAQWETARLEAEARQVKQYSKLQLLNQLGSSSSSQPSLTRLVLNKVTPRPLPPPRLDVLKVWQNSWSSSTSEDQNTPRIMHSMYAMMLATDDLESPASTLSFPDTVPSNSKLCTNDNTTFGKMINQSSLPSSFKTTTTVANYDGIVKGARSDTENKEGSLLGDEDNIMVAVEAFRSTGCNNSMEGLHHDDVLAYGFSAKSASSYQQNLGVLGVEEEGQDWEDILDLVNGLPSSPVFFPVL